MEQKFLEAVTLLEKIENEGFEAYFVGGSVRDHLLKREISDVDIATSATPYEIKQIFKNTVDVGIEHGTVLVLHKGKGYEITTFRSESEYKDFRRPDEVIFIKSLVEDLKRRDFTMNAIAMNKNGNLIDPFHGQEAILNKKIETVGSAEDRFSEDALRMMRAIRFVSQLSFTLDEACFQALEKMGPLLQQIAVERKTAEFEKLLAGKGRLTALELLCQLNLDGYLPGLKDLNKRLDAILQYNCFDLQLEEMWVLLLYSLQIETEAIEKFLREWKLSVKKIRKIKLINRWLRFRLYEDWNRTSMYEAGIDLIIHTERVLNVIHNREITHSSNYLKEEYDLLPIKSRSELAVTGKDLMEACGQAPGPWINLYLASIEQDILELKLENKSEQIREWVKKCNQK